MVRIPKPPSILQTRSIIKPQCRNISKYLDKDIAGKTIRKRFIEFFIDKHNHNFVKSSPVVPHCDPTVAFVNAGMNQFKGIFLGTQTPAYKRVVNSQKCVRVGGKHNDLDIVGSDGYHHTFFEMLGNWSFGDYSKKEACAMSWQLLTEVYKIHKLRLYVTYFGGDKQLGLKPDWECRDIWKSIGVPANRILPFGVKDNFWEMGLTGPCGPCTEIHIDHLGLTNRAEFVNKGLNDLTELWNIVFIQFNRETNGSIEPLPNSHIDTGMGFERLAAVLQGKLSNYDTDIFSNLFTGIQKACKNAPKYKGKFGEIDWNGMDAAYRILGDHSRMVTACLADGMIPEQNQKLRRVMRRAFLTSETYFNSEKGLLRELSNYVVENLGPVYPEMEKNIKQVHEIIDYEEEIYKMLRTNASTEWKKLAQNDAKLAQLNVLETPGLVAAYKELKQAGIAKITPEIGFKLYDTFGLDEETIGRLSQALNIEFDLKGFKNELENARIRSKEQVILNNSPCVKDALNRYGKTNDSFKYKYRKENDLYVFEPLEAGILQIIRDGDAVSKVEPHVDCSIILDRTNFYSEAGGQVSDEGQIQFADGNFEVTDVINADGCVLHKGFFINNTERPLKVGSRGTLKYNEERRLRNMQNHTAVHILNAVLKKCKGITCQKSSRVTPDVLNLDVGIFGEKLTENDVKSVEEEVNRLIRTKTDVDVKEVDSQKLLTIDRVTLIPGEVYPELGIRLVEMANYEIVSREPCCGTHVLNTSDIENFCIISCKSLGRSTTSIHAVTGKRAALAKQNGLDLLEDVEKLRKHINDNIDSPEVLDMAVMTLKQRLTFDIKGPGVLPYCIKLQCQKSLSEISKQIKDSARSTLKEFIEMEMQNVLETQLSKSQTNKEFLVHYLRSSMILESVPLQRATRMCPDIPVLVISFSENMVKARCCVPKKLASNNFDAEKWLTQVSRIFRSTAAAPKGQDPQLVCNMKAKKVNIQDWDTLLSDSLEVAKKYAEKYL